MTFIILKPISFPEIGLEAGQKFNWNFALGQSLSSCFMSKFIFMYYRHIWKYMGYDDHHHKDGLFFSHPPRDEDSVIYAFTNNYRVIKIYLYTWQ